MRGYALAEGLHNPSIQVIVQDAWGCAGLMEGVNISHFQAKYFADTKDDLLRYHLLLLGVELYYTND